MADAYVTSMLASVDLKLDPPNVAAAATSTYLLLEHFCASVKSLIELHYSGGLQASLDEAKVKFDRQPVNGVITARDLLAWAEVAKKQLGLPRQDGHGRAWSPSVGSSSVAEQYDYASICIRRDLDAVHELYAHRLEELRKEQLLAAKERDRALAFVQSHYSAITSLREPTKMEIGNRAFITADNIRYFKAEKEEFELNEPNVRMAIETYAEQARGELLLDNGRSGRHSAEPDFNKLILALRNQGRLYAVRDVQKIKSESDNGGSKTPRMV